MSAANDAGELCRFDGSIRILSDEEVLHWMAHNVQMMQNPAHQDAQAQMLLKMQISICTELMAFRKQRSNQERKA